MNRAPRTYLQQFNRASSQKLSDLRRRGQAKVDKRGRVLRVAAPCEITLEQFRGWMLEKFGDEGGHCPCAYCGRQLTPVGFVPDHKIALNRGGFNDLQNLAVCCEACNDRKGEIQSDSFQYLLRCLEQMRESDRAIILGRLAKSEQLAWQVRSQRAQMLRQRGPAQPPPTTAPLTRRGE